jgi:Ni/Co efflux regulator RcnB
MEEIEMKKLGYVIAALGAIAVAMPSMASAEKVVIKHRDHMHGDYHHAWHRDFDRHHHDKTVIIKNHRHES